MTKSYRIRTAINSSREVDQTIRVNIDQDFDFLEILSLKLTQSDIYRRFCSDYGVIAGRVVANGGFGIPNAKVSVFVPLDAIDENDPIISTLYPYKTPTQKNEDGYRYNLLPYEPSYEGHVPTGTFPSRDDILNRQEVLHIYEKYYKYTVTTNESGDYMIVGVPLGNQQVVVDVDLSDIGCFSLRPTDLIRINKGVPSQFDGNQFKSSEDLSSLPQLFNTTRTVNVSSFWGLGDNCDIGITRVDFDLRDFNINIEPTSTFMGSIFSSSDDTFLKNNCKPGTEQGDQCGLVTNPGRILAIRQTVNLDENGLPILEEYILPQGGKVIDENGAYVVDLPMNLDYVTTNEYGDIVVSDNPNVGIPTRAKYRFKIKYDGKEKDLSTVLNFNSFISNRLFNLSTFNPKGSLIRGNYLVPNIKEHGWTVGQDADPAYKDDYSTQTLDFDNNTTEENLLISVAAGRTLAVESITDYEGIKFYINGVLNNSKWIEMPNGGTVEIVVKKKTETVNVNGISVQQPKAVKLVLRNYDYNYVQFQKSYSFSLDWDDYPDIQDALNCNDTFYEMVYNKVYTTAQLIDEYRYGTSRGRFLSIKEILDRSCQGDANRFPTNDGVRNFDLLYFIISIFFYLFSITGPILILVYSLVKYLWNNFAVILASFFLAYTVYRVVTSGIVIAGMINVGGPVVGAILRESLEAIVWGSLGVIIGIFFKEITGFKFGPFKLPMVTYPDCSACDCGEQEFSDLPPVGEFNTSILADINTPSSYQPWDSKGGVTNLKKNIGYGQVVAGRDDSDGTTQGRTPKYTWGDDIYNSRTQQIGSAQLPMPERVNIFNTKGHYFTTVPGGGANRIKVFPNYENNIVGGGLEFYEDLPLVILADSSISTTYSAGTMMSFVSPSSSTDINYTAETKTLNGLNSFKVTGTTIPQGNNIVTIEYANPNNPSSLIQKNFNVVSDYTGQTIYKFASDIEYHQVITGITIGELETYITSTNKDNTLYDKGFYRRVIDGLMNVEWKFTNEEDDEVTGYSWDESPYPRKPITQIPNYKSLVVMVLMKGVDPYSTRQKTKVDVSKIFGLNENTMVVENNYKLNIPIKTGLPLEKYNTLTNNVSNKLFSPSYFFTPSNVSGVWNYSAYTTYNHLLYSSYDNSTDNLIIGNNGQGYWGLSTVTAGSLGGRTNNLVTNSPDAYYVNEYVEGGTAIARVKPSPTSPNMNDDYSYAAFVYNPTGATINMSDRTKIIMRSDRLPRSDKFDNDYVLAQNKTFATYLINDNGSSAEVVGSISSTSDFSTSLSGDFQQAYGTGTTSIMNSFSCNTIVPLGAYNNQVDGETITVKPSTDPVYYTGGDDNYPKIDNGCYVMCDKDLAIADDWENFAEWKSRVLLNLAICRNVFGLTFTNQWINGTLYMPGFQNDKIYPGIEVTNPTYVYCKDKIVFREGNNSFFYRSSPYRDTLGFVGMVANKDSNITGEQLGNDYFLGSPTTILDLGPKDNIIQNVCPRPEFQGYYINRLNGTSYSQPGDLLQLFIISRLTNASAIQQLFGAGGASVGEFFSREDGQKIDGDFAQLNSINSEFGVVPFSPESYTSESLFFGKSKDPVMGVFFSSDTISRDFISPGRTTFIDTTKKFANNRYGFQSQVVPMYKWKLNSGKYIFGDENNTWKTTPMNTNVFYSIGYQNIDRLNNDTYYQSPILNPTGQRPGYIYSSAPLKDSLGNITGFTNSAFQKNNTTSEFIVGAPYHFYFGIKYGKTALDKFITNNLVE